MRIFPHLKKKTYVCRCTYKSHDKERPTVFLRSLKQNTIEEIEEIEVSDADLEVRQTTA